MITIENIEYTIEELIALISSINDVQTNPQNENQRLFLEYVDAAISFNPRNYDQEFPFSYTVMEYDSRIMRSLVIERSDLEAIGYEFRSPAEYDALKKRLVMKQYFIALVFDLGLNRNRTSDHSHFYYNTREYNFARQREPDKIEMGSISVQQMYWLVESLTPNVIRKYKIDEYARKRLEIQYIIGDLSSAIVLSNLGFLQDLDRLQRAEIGARAMTNTYAFDVFFRTALGLDNLAGIFDTLIKIISTHKLTAELLRVTNAIPLEMLAGGVITLDDNVLKKIVLAEPLSEKSMYIMRKYDHIAQVILSELGAMHTKEARDAFSILYDVVKYRDPEPSVEMMYEMIDTDSKRGQPKRLFGGARPVSAMDGARPAQSSASVMDGARPAQSSARPHMSRSDEGVGRMLGQELPDFTDLNSHASKSKKQAANMFARTFGSKYGSQSVKMQQQPSPSTDEPVEPRQHPQPTVRATSEENRRTIAAIRNRASEIGGAVVAATWEEKALEDIRKRRGVEYAKQLVRNQDDDHRDLMEARRLREEEEERVDKEEALRRRAYEREFSVPRQTTQPNSEEERRKREEEKRRKEHEWFLKRARK